MSKELFIPMSSLQCAYMIERERGLKTTGTPCHVYMEFDTVSINETHLRKAWETLYVRHPMMRAKAEMCGLLKIEELNDREAERTIKIWEEDIFIKENMREILSHEKLDIRNGINCRLHLIKRHQKIVRLAFDLDLTMCDVLSFLIILRDLGEFYRYFKRGIIREYHSNEIEEEVLLSENRKSDKVYWEQRLRNSDIAFPLKVKGSIEELVKTKYISINRKMDKKVLDRLTLKLKISTEEILLIVFSYTVLKYTKKEQVLINFPFSNRTKERQNRVGDYTKSIIYRCDIKRGVAFNEFCKAMHKKYKEDIKHVDLDGVSVQRILKNHCQGNEKYPVPLVFSPSFEIPMLSEVFLNEIGDLSYIISQTPGVQRLHSMSATERMNDLYTTIERPNGQLMEHQRKMLNVLFRVFAQNFRCVSSYIPKVYTGKMRVFDCESAIANFFPSLFSEDKKTWEQYAQGEFLFDTMKGDHISCMNSPYIEENVKKILDL